MKSMLTLICMHRYKEALVSLKHELEAQQLPLDTNIALLTRSIHQLEATTAALCSGIELKASDSVEAFSGMREQLQQVLLNGEAALEVAAVAAGQHSLQPALNSKVAKQFQSLRLRPKQSAQAMDRCKRVAAVSTMQSSLAGISLSPYHSSDTQGAVEPAALCMKSAAAADACQATSNCKRHIEQYSLAAGYHATRGSNFCSSSPGSRRHGLNQVRVNPPGSPNAQHMRHVIQPWDQLKRQEKYIQSAARRRSSKASATQVRPSSGAAAELTQAGAVLAQAAAAAAAVGAGPVGGAAAAAGASMVDSSSSNGRRFLGNSQQDGANQPG
jgi:hypothetical protein